MFDPSYATNSKDAPKIHTVTKDGCTISMERMDPYGHVYMVSDKGELPVKYQGAYTEMRIAESDALRYLEERSKAVIDVKTEGDSRRKLLR